MMRDTTTHVVRDPVLARLQAEVIAAGLCTHCGTCSGLSPAGLEMRETPRGPLPFCRSEQHPPLPEAAFTACPGKGINYPDMCRFTFDAQPDNWLVGCYRNIFVGYSGVPAVRRGGASGGVITQTLLYLLEQNYIQGAVVVRQGQPRPWLAQPVIARTADEIMAAGQSVYIPVPVNTLLDQMAAFDGRLAYVGLPDQVAALRYLQYLEHPGAAKVDYVLGPYVGTNNYLEAIASYLRSHGIHRLEEIVELRYREGEWPGYLQIKTRSGQVLKAEKFYYNYLIPFYITYSTLMSVDFTNELTDISVGDAWSPRYESQGGGFSVVVARSAKGEQLLADMHRQKLLHLEEIAVDQALTMHGHMLDFKKRGTFIRMNWRRLQGKHIPDYGYRPTHIPLMRQLTEAVITAIFAMCCTLPARRLVELVPLAIIGPIFDTLRKSWKRLSKPVKRKGLQTASFATWSAHVERNSTPHTRQGSR
jgi:coenzyme F420 hydrogenase subunit beta